MYLTENFTNTSDTFYQAEFMALHCVTIYYMKSDFNFYIFKVQINCGFQCDVLFPLHCQTSLQCSINLLLT